MLLQHFMTWLIKMVSSKKKKCVLRYLVQEALGPLYMLLYLLLVTFITCILHEAVEESIVTFEIKYCCDDC